jgi:CheY-like chemotaxis protein
MSFLMNAPPQVEGTVLVASSGSADAELVADLLREEFAQVAVSTNSNRAVADFEQLRPRLLVLAFRSIDDAERYYLGLHRFCEQLHAIPHRTLVLCERGDAHRVYELCRRQYFDDYVVFWPVSHDPYRIRMSAIHALRAAEAGEASGPSPHLLAMHARRIAELKTLLERNLADGGQRVARVMASVKQAQSELGESIADFSRRFEDGRYEGLVEIKDQRRFDQELRTLREDALQAPFDGIDSAVAPIQEWMHALNAQVEPSMRSAEALATIAEHTRPVVLLVDDDAFQHRLLKHQLADTGLDLMFASNGTGALSLMRSRRPDLILMDFNLPDMSGAEVIRRLKSSDRTAAIPVMLITGTSTKDVVVESHRAGAVDVMAKPLDTGRLLAGIRMHLAGEQTAR